MNAPSPAPPLLRLRGPVALSPFRIEKLLAPLKAAHPEITALHAEFAHFALLKRALQPETRAVLEKLLTYGNAADAARQGTLFLVLPRSGTISPWSSRATEIARICGLADVARIERGIAFQLETKTGSLSAAAAEAMRRCIHDPMVEMVGESLDAAAELFIAQAPAPIAWAPLVKQGKAALESLPSSRAWDKGLAWFAVIAP